MNLAHEFDEEGVCIHCAFDSVEWAQINRAYGKSKISPPCTVRDPKIRQENSARYHFFFDYEEDEF